MVQALKDYVKDGGKLLVSGAKAVERFGGAFLGVGAGRWVDKAIYHVPAEDGTVPVFSEPWRLVRLAGARSLGSLGTTPLAGERMLPHPAATLNRVGKGAVACIPGSVFRDFNRSRYPLTRAFVHDVTRALAGRMDIEVEAPACVDVVLRQKGARRIIHLINRSSGIPNLPNSGVIDEIPAVGPVTIAMRVVARPKKVTLAFEKTGIQLKYVPARKAGSVRIVVAAVRIHSAVVVEG